MPNIMSITKKPSGGGGGSTGFADTFTATAGQTVFTISQPAGTLLAFVNGILLGASEFTLAGTTLTLHAGLRSGDALDVYGSFIVGPGTGVINNALYLSPDPQVDGNWRIILSGNNLSMQRREGGVWLEKSVVLP